MKKTGLLLSIFIIATLILNIIPIHAAIDPTNYQDPLGIGINPEKIPQNPDQAKDIGTKYLKQEWTKILEKTQTGRILLKVSDLLGSLNFFWKPVLGMEYSLSWLFIFAVAIWLILFFIIYGLLSAIFGNKISGIIGGFCVASLVGLSGVIKKAVDLLSFAIKNVWIAWLSLFIAIMIMFLIIHFSGGLKAYSQKQKEQAEKEKTERAQKIIQTKGEIVEEELEESGN
jgi:ABC-type multidrug transport system fused ATPase/permease subunit